MAASLDFNGLRHTCALWMMDPRAPRGFLIRIDTCQQFTRFEGIQQVQLRAGPAAAGGGRNGLK